MKMQRRLKNLWWIICQNRRKITFAATAITIFITMGAFPILQGCTDIEEWNVATGDRPETIDNIETDVMPITMTQASTIAFDAGVDPVRMIYADALPMIISNEEAEMTWGFIERSDDADFLVTTIDRWNGNILSFKEPIEDNIRKFLSSTHLDVHDPTLLPIAGSSSNSYNSFPWGFRLPFEETSNAWITCGYGCGGHTGIDVYATDWDPGNEGHLMESPASCWVVYTTYAAGTYGNQIVAECGDAGNGKRFYTREAHMRDQPLVKPGDWINKGKNIGYMGHSGSATGDHIHFVAYKAKSFANGSFTSGEGVPINKWPSSGDSLCDGKFAGYNFSGSPWMNIGAIQTTGCP